MVVARVCLLLLLGVAGVVHAGQFVFPRAHHHYHEDYPTTPRPNRAPREMPLSLIRKLNAVENMQEFLNNFINESTLTGFSIADRIGETDERKSVLVAKQAICKPELTVVSLDIPLSPRLNSWPTCTRIERCGGCCQHKLLNCQPTDTEIVNFEIVIIEYTGEDFLAQKRKEITSLERHLKCKCDCIVKEKHCNSIQKYDSDECACVCTNIDEEEKCRRDNDTKYWDSRECSCKCLQVRECSTGYDFDQKTCSCQQLNIRRRRIEESGPDNQRNFKYNTDRVNIIPPLVPDSGDS